MPEVLSINRIWGWVAIVELDHVSSRMACSVLEDLVLRLVGQTEAESILGFGLLFILCGSF
jgi:hypothetical protein